ncbi:universal stress protein [Picrophilus oshimae]|uniref:Universal stress protein family n=1 Tax=Picrophilus torridus (strain ATCC 700027 / DSM 9790 / JCM 10055 / NBRC 100828 / KAW 2/3) TaxID=1122961 RepID=Q6L2R3_PICTO|nr:universal stress protein [Picrophilus oshimae]AAT42739.1 universal stress protein family [Picrophilus oshimae DSM 9789]
MFESSRSYSIKSDRILVPMFKGTNSIKALQLAFDISQHENSEITAITVRERSDSVEWTNSVNLVTNAFKDGKRRGIKVVPKIKTSDNVRTGLIEEANSRSYDILIIATHKRATLSGSIFGSIGDYLLKNINIPIALMSISEKNYPYKKIFIPVSEEINTRSGVSFGFLISSITGSEIVLIDLRKYDKIRRHGFKMLFDNLGLLSSKYNIRLIKSGENTGIKEELNYMIGSEDPDAIVIGARSIQGKKFRINSDLKYIIKDTRLDTLLIKK